MNQVLLHAGNTPDELLDFCEERNVLVQAYSPIAHGTLLDSRQIKMMAQKYQVSVPQLCIRYTLQLGTQPLPKTANPAHMRSNADVGFEISEDDMAALGTLDERDYGEHSAFPVYSGK